MILKRILSAAILASAAVLICSFLFTQGITIMGEELFSPFAILLLIAVVFGELTAVSL